MAPQDPRRAFLGVERSITGRRWKARLEDERAALALSQRMNLPEIVGRVLAARGVGPDEVETFLNPTLRALLPDPSHLRDMDVAVERLVRAITRGETVGVFGDYDVDGATSAALIARFFKAIGRSVQVYVPDRLREGYGPNVNGLQQLKAAGASVVLTVDCGTTAFAALAEAKALGLDVIVVDHHVAEPGLPEALAVVNPNRFDETSLHRQLAAVGVAFLLVVALNRALRDAHWYGEGHAEPDLMAWLDLVALGTVCDVVPLTGANRALVTQGLKVMARRSNAGLVALADVARLDERPDAYHAGFIFGPRVNAGGRVGEAGLGARLLASDDAAEARAIAVRLDQFNRERQEIEACVLSHALTLAEQEIAAGGEVLVVAGQGWHPGVIGIVAGRLRERFNLPTCVVALEGGRGKGSGRSVPGVRLGAAVIAARQAGLLVDGGGHDMAAGFTVRAEALPAFRAFLVEHIDTQLGGQRLVPALNLDGALAPAAATPDLVRLLDQAGPFGAGNPRPRFAFPDVRIAYAERTSGSGGHIRLRIASGDAGKPVKAMAFRAAGTSLGEALLTASGVPLHLAGHLQRNTWQGGNAVDLIIEDAARA
jgi:single-stranded-DNA-specific exonuclease